MTTRNNSYHARRFSELPLWAKWICNEPKTTIAAVLLFPTLLGAVLSLLLGGFMLILGMIISSILIVLGIKKVPAEPVPMVAILQCLELRLPIVFHEGFVIIVPGIMAPDVPEPLPGGKVTVTVQVAVRPNIDDGWSLIDLLNRGGIGSIDRSNPDKVTGALGFLRGIVAEDVRQVGRSLTWTDMAYSTDILSAKLIGDVTGHRMLPGETTPVLENPTEDRIRYFLEEVKRNGLSDIKGTGFIVRTLNVQTVTPAGKLKDEVDRIAIEDIKAVQLQTNATALRDGMNTIKGTDGSITDAGALAALQAEDGTVKKEFKEYKIADVGEIAEALKILAGKK
jgi:hypothetical protein